MRIIRPLSGLALIVVTLLAGTLSPVPLRAAPPPPSPQPDILDIGNIHIMPSDQFLQQAHAVPQAEGDPHALVTYRGGTIMPSATTYAIFWLPPGLHFEPSPGSGATDASNDTRYESLITRFLGDLAGSAHYALMTQYSTPMQKFTANYRYGGSYLYTSPYPTDGTTMHPLLDSDFQAAVQAVIQANSWTADPTHQFLFYTGFNVHSCKDASQSYCSGSGYCAYHGWSGDPQTPLLYANMADDWSANSNGATPGCANTRNGSGGFYSPSGDIGADAEINTTSHEIFELVSDPVTRQDQAKHVLSAGWKDSGGAEIGDKCIGIFGAVAPDGSNITLNRNKYIVQQIWSNQASNGTTASGCVMALGAPGMPNSNDSFANAQPITPFPFQTVQSTFGFTSEPTDPALRCAGSASRPQGSASAWFRLTAPASGRIWASTDVRSPVTGTVDGTSYDTVLAVLAGASPASSSLLACSNNLSSTDLSSTVANVSVTAGATYYLEVTAQGTTPGGTLALQVTWSGDVNADGQVNAVDALCVLRSVAGLSATNACLVVPLVAGSAGDLTADGQVNAVDALCLLRSVAGLSATTVCPTGPTPAAAAGLSLYLARRQVAETMQFSSARISR
ncbi:MAG: dockerin type I domain-containing protein [Dehalococcoidia bacterium]